MKKFIPFILLLFFWATAFAGSKPPYAASYSLNPFSLEELQSERNIEMYPNPMTEGVLTIRSGESFYAVQILNITGKIVFSQDFPTGTTSELLELSRLDKGMYLVRILFSNNTSQTGKLIVK
jgi:hypothetical protein